MASEISHRHSATGETLYFTIRNTARQMWNTAGTPNFETLVVANWTSYDVAMAESPASSYFFAGTFPAISGNMVAGWYWADIYKQAGGSPAITDVLQASYFGYWNGATFKWWGSDTLQIAGASPGVQQTADNNTLLELIQAKTTNLPSDPADQSELAALLTAILNAINSANYAQTRFRFSIPEGVEVPESGSAGYVLGITTYNASGVLTDLDSLPTITSFYADGTSAAALFGSVSNVGTGQYNLTLTIASGTVANKFVRVVGTGNMSGQALGMFDYVWIENDISPDFSSTDRTKLEAIHAKLPSKTYLAGTSNSDGDVQLDEATGTIARVTLVDTTTTNTDMRGTDAAMLAVSYAAPPSAAANAAATAAQITADHGSGSYVSSVAGSGPFALTVTVNDGAAVLQNAVVELSEGANNFRVTTNASGVAVFGLNAATYAVIITKDGYSFTPTTKVVSATGSQTYSMTALPISGSPAGQATGYGYTYNSSRVLAGGVVVELQQTASATAGLITNGTFVTATSAAITGLVQFTGLFQGATYSLRIGSNSVSFTVPNSGANFLLPALISG